MKAKSIAVLLLLMGYCFFSANGQELLYKNYKWEEKEWDFPTETEEDKILLYNKDLVEFAFDGDFFIEYYLLHIVEYIHTEEAVEANNRKYIPFGQQAEVIEAKAKVIKPDQSSIVLDKSKILSSYDEQTGAKYKYFALEGLQKGNIIDYYYVVKKNPDYTGNVMVFQSEYPLKKYEFDLYAPPNLIFSFKTKNEEMKVQKDTAMEDKNHWYLELENIPALKKEESAPYSLLLKKLIYKLDENLANNTKNITSYGKASQNVYTNIYEGLNKKDEKALLKLIKKMKIEEDLNEEQKIGLIENYVKSNINLIEARDEKYSEIASIIPDKVATRFGITKLFANIFKLMEIEHDLVLTSDRTQSLFDPDFESFHYLSKYLIYFPTTNEYIAPDDFAHRNGLIPYQYTNTHGLFIKEVKIGDFQTGLGQVKFIDLLPYERSSYDHLVSARIEEDFSNVYLEADHLTSGYYAVFLQPYLESLSKDIVENITDETLKNYLPHFENETAEWVNDKAELTGLAPLILKTTGNSTELIDVAGNRYLFKIGELIGPQMELYSEEERKLPVYDEYKRAFIRKLTIEIPKGYKVQNPEVLNVNESHVVDGDTLMMFNSRYEITNNTITVDIEEYYDKVYFTLEEYPAYRNIVNSASDFNKAVLVISEE